MKLALDATGKTGDISTTYVKTMKLSISARQWDHSISNTFLNPTVKSRGKCEHADINECLNQMASSNGFLYSGKRQEATEEYSEITESNTGRDSNSLHQLLHLRIFNQGNLC